MSCFRTDVVFSPDDKVLMTGISVKKGMGEGKLVFLGRENLETVNEMPIADGVKLKYVFVVCLRQLCGFRVCPNVCGIQNLIKSSWGVLTGR